jgi:hypothetical protein
MKKWIIFILFIFCVEIIFAQGVLKLNSKSSLKKNLVDSTSMYVLNGRSPRAVLTDKKDIICVADSWNAQIHSIAARIDSSGNIIWNNVQLCIAKDSLGLDEDENAYILPRTDGGVYFVFDYLEYRSFQDGMEIYAVYPHIQYVDASGNVMWGPSGKRLTNMVVDYLGGATMQQISFTPDGDIMVYWTWFNDHTNSGIPNEFGTYVQKVDPSSGEIKFGAAGKKLFNFKASQIKESPNGNVYILQDPYVFQNGGDSLACFNSLAEKQWQLPLLDGSGLANSLIDINEYNELLLVYTTANDIRARLYDKNGSPIWIDKIISSSFHWINTTTIEQWALNRWVFISGATANCVFCIDRVGTNYWGDSGINLIGGISSVQPVDDESIFVSFGKPNPIGNYVYDLYLQKLNINGDAVWDSSGKKIFENVNIHCVILPDKKGGAYLIFDALYGYPPQNLPRGIYFQKVDKDGNLGLITSVKGNTINNNISTTTSVVCYPNPSNGMQSFSIKTKSGDEVQKIILYDILGREVRKLNIGNPSLGETFLRWDGKNNNGIYTAPGVYFYYMKTKNNINISGKLIRIK